MSESTKVVCSECGKGNYFRDARGLREWFDCTACEHTIGECDVTLDDGESLVVVDDILHVVQS